MAFDKRMMKRFDFHCEQTKNTGENKNRIVNRELPILCCVVNIVYSAGCRSGEDRTEQDVEWYPQGSRLLVDNTSSLSVLPHYGVALQKKILGKTNTALTDGPSYLFQMLWLILFSIMCSSLCQCSVRVAGCGFTFYGFNSFCFVSFNAAFLDKKIEPWGSGRTAVFLHELTAILPMWLVFTVCFYSPRERSQSHYNPARIITPP